jgi:hypothetical protein
MMTAVARVDELGDTVRHHRHPVLVVLDLLWRTNDQRRSGARYKARSVPEVGLGRLQSLVQASLSTDRRVDSISSNSG